MWLMSRQRTAWLCINVVDFPIVVV